MNADFLRLSSALTGFEAAELTGTGMTELYRATVSERIGVENLDRLGVALAAVGDDPQALADPVLLELARAVCGLWYLGVWPGLPAPACRSLGLTQSQEPFRPSASAYAEGLLWRALGSHAPGTQAPGFGSWADPPPGASPPGAPPSALAGDRPARTEGAGR